MIPKSSKFLLRTDFLRFRARAKRRVTSALTLHLLTTPSSPRLGVIVPKKASKLATTRNYLKRLVYDTLWPQIKDQKMDVVVVFKPLPLKKTSATKKLLLSELHV